MGERNGGTLNAPPPSCLSSSVKICKILCFHFLKELGSSLNVKGLIYPPTYVGIYVFF